MTSATLQQQPTLVNWTSVAVVLPVLEYGPSWDEDMQEWQARDSDGIAYYGDTPGSVYQQFHAALHEIAAHLAVCPEDAGLRGDVRRWQDERETGRP